MPRAHVAGLRPGWSLEAGTNTPTFASISPKSNNTTLETVVLSCEETPHSRVLQLQLFTISGGPLEPAYMQLHRLKSSPGVTITIDRRVFPVMLLSADGYAVVADTLDGLYPALSGRLLEAMETGATMTLHFDLLEEWPGDPPYFDTEAVVELQAAGAPEAIRALRRCAQPPAWTRSN